MKNILLPFLLVFVTTVNAQKITGFIVNEANQPVAWATASLLTMPDSTVAKLATTNEKGVYQFNDIIPGQYKILVSAVGLEHSSTSIVTVAGDSISLPVLVLSKKATSLEGVQVTATRPLIQVKADKTILNVEGTINATGSDALELLRKAPGVLVDKDDNLSLSGKSGVQVYIDGKPSPLAGKELSEYLKTVQSAQIESFEIITNPSAKYEAAGNAGIINIRMKKNKSYGTNGTFNAGYGIGTFPKFNGGFSLNNRNAVSNIFGTFNANRNKSYNEMFFYRTLGDSIFDQKTTMINRNRNFNYKVGADFFLNKFNTLGIMLHGSNGDNMSASHSLTSIFSQPGISLVKFLQAENSNDGSRNNTNANINYRFADTSGHELNIDLDYGAYRVNSDQWQPNYYVDPYGNFLNSLVYNMIAPTDIDLYSVKADYEQDFKKGKLGLGAKVAYVETDNDFQRYNVYTSNKELDTLRSNRFRYKENINALYANYNRPFKGFAVQVGVRLENTVSEGNSAGFRQVGQSYTSYDSSFKRPYTDLFPSMAITFNKNPMSQFSFTYSRRIDRPAYQDLNPFEFKIDEYTFQKGNTQLRPQYTNSFGFTHTYKYKLNTSLNYSHVKDIFAQLVDTAELSKSFISKRNLATQDIVSLNISYPYSYKKYSAFINVNTYYSKFKADFGTNRKVDLDVFSFNLYGQQSLKFAKTWTAELSGWYTAPSIWQGTFKSDGMGGLDAGIQKSLFKTKGTLKISVSDIFHSMQWGGSSEFAGQAFRGHGSWEAQQFKANFTYRFGNTNVKASRQRKNAIEEESKRASQSQGGIGAQ